MPAKIWISLGALSAGIAVALGAMGAHALETWLIEHDPKHNFETAVRYQMYHAVGLILVGLAATQSKSGWLTGAGWTFLIGTLLFSGGLYGWIFTGIKPFVAIVPVGGTTWLIGWILFALDGLLKKSAAGS